MLTFLLTFLSRRRRVGSTEALRFLLLKKAAMIWQRFSLSALRKSMNVVIASSIIETNESDEILELIRSSFFSAGSSESVSINKHT